MDDTQQAQPTVNSQQNAPTSIGDLAGAMPTASGMPGGMVPGGDLSVPAAGMTPPPAAPMSGMPTEPAAPAISESPMTSTMPKPSIPAKDATAPVEGVDDSSYAEDILGEILDSLDRIEVKLEALEKKTP